MSQPTSPTTSRKNLVCRVLMLDDTEEIFYVPNKGLGGVLFIKVVQKLQLLEADYFDLQYKNVEGILCWLDHEKPITSHMPQNSLNFEFVVKFYTPDPGMLEEELTRYLFALQVKRDLATGQMPCQEQTAALLASYIVQAEFGDLTDEGYENAPDYLKSFKLFPNISNEMEARIIQHHREHFGQTPMDADYNLLDTARKVEFYGICMHDAKDHEGVALHLAVTHMGVVVFQNMTRINTFSWAKIRKLSFKRKKFLIKLHPEGYGFYKDTVEFYFSSRNECKNFWKKCLEHHAFFRCQSVKKIPRNKTRVVSHGSSFRYSGKTQKQLVDFVRENFSKRPCSFLRSTSMRTVNFGGGATPRTGTLRSLRHSHQPHHESPQPNEDRSIQPFSPMKLDHCSPNTFPNSGLNEATFMPMQKNTHTLPKESKPSASNENEKKQARSKELEMSQPIIAKAEEKQLQDLINNSQNSAQLLRTQETKEEGREEESVNNMADFISLSIQQEPNSTLDCKDKSITNVPALAPSLHQQFQLCHEIQKQQPQRNNCLPISSVAHFPLYPSTNASTAPSTNNNNNDNDINILISGGMTTTPILGGFSKSLSIQLSGSPSQPRYFCTDVDSCELPISFDNLPIHQSEGSMDRKIQFLSSNSRPNPIQTKALELNPIIGSDVQSHKSLEALRLPTIQQQQQQQQNKSHSINFLSKNEVPANFLTSEEGRKVLSTKPNLSEVERIALSSDLSSSCIMDSNVLSVSSQLTSATGDESVLPIGDQAWGSTDIDIKKVISIPGYYIGKELLMSERTYKRDLEIMVEGFQWMSDNLGCGLSHNPSPNSHVIQETLQLFTPIFQIHTDFLQSIETRIIEWENVCTSFEKRRMGDLFALNISMLRLYNYYLSNEEELLKKLYMTLNNDSQFRLTFQKFETSKTCYQPISAFLLKPYQRLQHYEHILNKFIEVCGNDHNDLENCEESKIAILDIITTFKDTHSQMINLQKLCELQQNIAGIGDLFSLRPQFIREGCLQKLSDNGYHQRLFILFDDFLVCANRRVLGNYQFVVHAHIPMENIQIEVFKKVNTGSEKHDRAQEDALINNGFLIRVFGSDSHVIEVAASSTAEKNKWLEDLNAAVSFARRRREITSRKNFFDSMETIFNNNSDGMNLESKQLLSPTLPLSPISQPSFHTLIPASSSLLQQQQHHHTNTMMFVCWHRNTSICMAERRMAVKNCLSGFLLRKFKTSLGWQKLWVIFSNLCLFFYKSFKDEFPLASLPLLGYSISPANQSDGIDKNFVFKLTFKSHAYFFRAESQCTFERWMEVIGSTIEYSRHFRLFSRMDSFSIDGTR